MRAADLIPLSMLFGSKAGGLPFLIASIVSWANCLTCAATPATRETAPGSAMPPLTTSPFLQTLSARSLIRSASFAQWMSSGIISASRWDSLRWEISTRYAFICSRISSTSRSAVSIDSGLTDVLPRLLLSATEATVHARRVISATAEAAACKARAGATSRLGSSVSVRDSPLERMIVSQIRASAGMKADSRITFPTLKSVWAMAT